MEDIVADVGVFQDSKQIHSIIEQLNSQRNTEHLCDVILRIFDIQILAHSCVLAAASPYFAQLFREQDVPRQFSPKTPQVIEIHIDGHNDPFYKNAVTKVVNFMYTSQIELEAALLAPVQEIAKIMQIPTIIEFCDLFLQGHRHVRNELLKCDAESQTSNGTLSREKELIVVRRPVYSDTDERWKYDRRLTKKPEVVLGIPVHRKRGRPRKEVKQENETQMAKEGVSTKSPNKKSSSQDIATKGDSEKENVQTDSKDGSGEPMDAENQEKIIKTTQSSLEIENTTQLRVSRRGRIIKPRKFPDDIVSDIKKEVLSDIEQELDDSDAREIIEHLKLLDEEGTDPTFRGNDEVTDPTFEGNKQTDDVSPLRRHYLCDQCSFVTSKLHEYNEHYKVHLHAEKKCSFCGWVCENPNITDEEFEAHLNSHKGDQPYFCNFCSLRFNTKGKLYQHLPKHSKMKPYRCDICQAGFKWKHALKSHMVTHKGTKDHLCDICGFATAHKTQLKAHHLIHSGDTFKCSEFGCDYQATKKTNLQFHMLTHTREKPHQCEVCGTRFSLVKNLRRHYRLHMSNRSMRCESCSFTTTRYDKLREHHFKQHNIGEKPAKKFRLSDYLKQKANTDLTTMSTQEDMVRLVEEEGEYIKETGEQSIVIEEPAINLGELEGIELQVDGSDSNVSHTQIVNVTSSTGESIPITITQRGKEISYEIALNPVQGEVNETYEIPPFPVVEETVTEETVTVTDVIEEVDTN